MKRLILLLSTTWLAVPAAWTQTVGDVPPLQTGLGAGSGIGSVGAGPAPGATPSPLASLGLGITRLSATAAPSISADPRAMARAVSISPRANTPPAAPASLSLPHAPVPGTAGAGPAAAAEPERPASRSAQASPRGPPELAAAVRGADAYIRGIAGRSAINAGQKHGLLGLFMEESGIDPDSSLGRALQASFFPEEAAAIQEAVASLDPRFNHFASLILALAREYEVGPDRVEGVIRAYGLENVLARSRNKATVESLLRSALFRDQVETVLSRYPDNIQGSALRELGGNLVAKTGKSLEEISRAGAFLYADFSGLAVRAASAGRDPDVRTADVLFYILLQDRRWKIDVYRQNERPGRSRRPDSAYVRALKDWLLAGGIPPADFTD